MTSKRVALLTIAGAVLVVAAFLALPIALRAQQAAPPHHPAAERKHGGVVVVLCDGKTTLEVKGLKPGQRMSHDQALGVTRELMSEWQRKHPGEHWEMAQAAASSGGAQAPAASPATSMGGGAETQTGGVPAKTPFKMQQGDTYASFHPRDFKLWQAETQKFVDEGKRIFHSADLLGGTVGISCDMCHPDASNTHPETYPKYQVQLQRVALLRDMIDWCIENPVKGKALDPNDERLRALEAYILAQRKGMELVYGKH